MHKFVLYAAVEVVYDNGAINRDYSQEEFLKNIVVKLQEEYSGAQCDKVGELLGTLTLNDVEQLCAGDEDSRTAALAKLPECDQGLVDSMLEYIFENL